jgi:SAM-dependent methyltransferase
MDSNYDNPRWMANAVSEGRHRSLIGGGWEVIGALQLKFLSANGLKPEHALLDVGCGSLRGGVHLVPYLNAGNYFGIDINQPLLDAGYEKEIIPLNLADRLPRENLAAVGDFDVAPIFNRTFDYLLAVSVFTHLNWNRIRQAIENLAAVARPGSVFFATYFHLPEDARANAPHTQPPGQHTTFGHRDPFHYRVSDFEQAIRNLPWRLEGSREWNHPRGQRMLTFTRLDH